MVLVAMFFAGLVLGGVVVKLLSPREKKPIGSLKVDISDPEDGPYLFLELSADPRNIQHEKYIMLKVDVTNFISQK